MEEFSEAVARIIFLIAITCISFLGLLFGGFASDGGKNPIATTIGLCSILFGLLGLAILLSPWDFLFSGSRRSMLLWGAFALSIFLPFVLILVAIFH